MRRAAKVDSTQAAIVEGLRKRGYDCYLIKLPVDVLVHWKRDGKHCWQPLECKSPRNKKLEPRLDARQKAQEAFCVATSTPRVTTLKQAIEALESV